MNFEDSCKAQRIDVTRLYDPSAGYAGVKNICDFIVYEYPHIFYFEMKARKGKRINFNVITDNQFNGLMEKTEYYGAIAGVIFKFTDFENKAYFLDIRVINALKQAGVKSITPEDAAEEGVLLSGQRKRTNYDYDVQEFLNSVIGGWIA